MHLYTVSLNPLVLSFVEGFAFRSVHRPERGGLRYVLDDHILRVPLCRSLKQNLINGQTLLDGYFQCDTENPRMCVVRKDLQKPRKDTEGVLVHIKVDLPVGRVCEISSTQPDSRRFAWNTVGPHKKSLIVHIPDGHHVYVYLGKFLVGALVCKGTNLQLQKLTALALSSETEAAALPAESPQVQAGKSLLSVLSNSLRFRFLSLLKILQSRLMPGPKYRRDVGAMDVR